MSFGHIQNNYTVVGENNHNSLDIKTRRLNKIVTEVAPAEVSSVGAVNGAYQEGGVLQPFIGLEVDCNI